MTLAEVSIGGKQMPTFRLDQEPWIPVVSADGVSKFVNLVQLFGDATKISGLAGSPLEVAAITRFLLAIVHLVETPASLNAWRDLWNSRSNVMSRCAKYVKEQGDTWDLFHKIHPFGQVRDLERTPNPAYILIYEAARKQNPVLIDHHFVKNPVPVRAAQLARSLIATNAFAGSSAAGANATYWSGSLAMRSIAMLCGSTLAETLLLNVLVQDRADLQYDWHRYGHQVDSETLSFDIARRYLWTSRRVRLLAEDNGRAAAIMMLAPGNNMPDNERPENPMVVMRKDAEGTAYVPLRLEAGRALWRSAHVLFNSQDGARRLGAIDQLQKLVRRGLISEDQPVSMRVCGVAGDAKGPTNEMWRDETLPFGVSVLTDDVRFTNLERAVTAAEETRRKLAARLKRFGTSYLGFDNQIEANRNRKNEDKEVDRLIGELVGFKQVKRGNETVTIPLYTDFWATISPFGERIACDGFDEGAVEATSRGLGRHISQRYRPLATACSPISCGINASRLMLNKVEKGIEKMTTALAKGSPLVNRLIELARKEDRGALSALRTGLGKAPGAAPRMLPIVAPFLMSDEGPATRAAFVTAALFGKHPEHASSGSLGASLWKATKREGINPDGKHGESGVEARFTAALDADPEDLARHLEGLVSLWKAPTYRSTGTNSTGICAACSGRTKIIRSAFGHAGHVTSGVVLLANLNPTNPLNRRMMNECQNRGTAPAPKFSTILRQSRRQQFAERLHVWRGPARPHFQPMP
jgi:CRISPR type I-E-associated protein CasA/Cse1/CRISPR type I-E-associated protein CasB/Cse2